VDHKGNVQEGQWEKNNFVGPIGEDMEGEWL
jgi:hypothetical protein